MTLYDFVVQNGPYTVEEAMVVASDIVRLLLLR
jgi:hypothetical protein